jgi:hypothetical protein
MLDIIVVILLGVSASKVARAKRRSGWWAVLPGAMWFGFEITGGFFAGLALRASNSATTVLIGGVIVGLACGAIGGWIGYRIVKGLTPLAAADAPVWSGYPPSSHVSESESAPAKRLAGFCAECGANVWLSPDGSCCNGHPSYQVSHIYSAPAE